MTKVFSLYEDSVTEKALWKESQKVTVTNGLISVGLGENEAINLAFDRLYYLGISIGKESEMKPRVKLSTSAYSFRADMLLFDYFTVELCRPESYSQCIL